MCDVCGVRFAGIRLDRYTLYAYAHDVHVSPHTQQKSALCSICSHTVGAHGSRSTPRWRLQTRGNGHLTEKGKSFSAGRRVSLQRMAAYAYSMRTYRS